MPTCVARRLLYDKLVCELLYNAAVTPDLLLRDNKGYSSLFYSILFYNSSPPEGATQMLFLSLKMVIVLYSRSNE